MPLRSSIGIFLILSLFLGFNQSLPAQAGLADHVVINEVHIDSVSGSGGTEDDWVELYNPTGNDISLEGWSIQKTPASGLGPIGEALHGTISAGGYLLIVRDGDTTAQSLKDMADILANNAFSLASNNIVILVDDLNNIDDFNDPNIVDFVGFGSASYYEGTSSAPNIAETKSIVRIPDGEDTDENSIDFILVDNPTPQNSGGGDNNNLEATVLLTITPNVETVQNIGPTSAQIVFELNANGNALVNYGLDNTYAESTSLEAVSLNTEKAISLSGLVCGTTYHYSIYAENVAGTENDTTSDATFTTLPCGILVDSLNMIKTSAKANNEYIDGWEWEFNITVWDMSETSLKMKFNSWNGLGALDSGANMQFSVDNNNWIDILANDVYPSVGADISGIDNDLASSGRQVQINVRMKLPVGTQAGDYSSSYGILTE